MNKTLEQLRKEIDVLDESMIEMLGKRMDIVKKIGKIKKELQQEIRDEQRWHIVLDNVKEQAKKLHLDSSFIENVYRLIHEHAQKLEGKE